MAGAIPFAKDDECGQQRADPCEDDGDRARHQIIAGVDLKVKLGLVQEPDGSRQEALATNDRLLFKLIRPEDLDVVAHQIDRLGCCRRR